jgi:hypothetical protein
MLPTPKTIAARIGCPMETARAIRRAIEAHERSGAPFATDTLERISAIMGPGAYGAESIPPGDGPRSPSIEYVNRGDTYDPTILYLDGISHGGRATGRGRWAVGTWGDIVERGRYE